VNFYGICDGLIVSQTDVYPIEMKLHGTKPTKSQKAQLIAYGILAQQKFSKQFNQGFFLFEQKGKTVPFKVTQDQKSELIELVEEIIKMIKSGKLPYSNASDEQCSQCEFENYCNDRF
jgi:CRISPR-associated exonuclease Cas4